MAAEPSKVGKRGTVVIPAALRRRFGITEGSLVIAEAREDGILLRPAVALPLDLARRQRLLDETNQAYAALHAEPEAWQAEVAEQEAWETTLLDGLDKDETWAAPGEGRATPRGVAQTPHG